MASLEDIGVERVVLTIQARKPGRAEFFRVHPDPDYTIDWAVLEREGESSREVYWPAQQYRGALIDELKPVRVFTCINKRNIVFLWPARLPSPDSAIGRSWAESALEIADYAKTSWVRMYGQRAAGAYEMFRAQGNLAEPVWPDKTLSDLLRLAFKGERLIDRLDHPVLRELAGEM